MKIEKITDRVVVNKLWTGLTSMEVCAVNDATDKEILQVCNRDNPAGTTNGWTVVVRGDNELKEHRLAETAKPVPCADHEGRTHFIVLC